jgi:purine-binding chemotaxis protein CheW
VIQFTTFYVGKTYFGIPILQVREINHNLRITEVPDSAPYIKGLLNLRGQIVTLFDLAVRLGRPTTEISPHTRNLILKTDLDTTKLREQGLLREKIGDDAVGFIVDRVADVVETDEHEIVPPPANVQDVQKEFITGVVELDRELLIVLNVAELVRASLG